MLNCPIFKYTWNSPFKSQKRFQRLKKRNCGLSPLYAATAKELISGRQSRDSGNGLVAIVSIVWISPLLSFVISEELVAACQCHYQPKVEGLLPV
jgi:hypothetical protein